MEKKGVKNANLRIILILFIIFISLGILFLILNSLGIFSKSLLNKSQNEFNSSFLDCGKYQISSMDPVVILHSNNSVFKCMGNSITSNCKNSFARINGISLNNDSLNVTYKILKNGSKCNIGLESSSGKKLVISCNLNFNKMKQNSFYKNPNFGNDSFAKIGLFAMIFLDPATNPSSNSVISSEFGYSDCKRY